MRVAFLGSGEFGLPTLRAVAARHEVVTVVSQPDRPAGRGGKLTPTPIAAWAGDTLAGVPLLKPEDVNEPGVVTAIHATRPDVMLVIAFGQKLSPGLVNPRGTGPRLGAINLHASLLPRHRGAAPIHWAILSGDSVTGNSVISIAERMDAGLIYAQSRRQIGHTQTTGELHDLLSADGPDLVLGVLNGLAAGTAVGVAQDETRKTRAGKLSREMAVVDFAAPADVCRQRINGLSPWPGVTVRFRGSPLKLLRASVAETRHCVSSGTIVESAEGLVACGHGSVLKVIEVQPAGKNVMAWRDFANGAKIKPQEGLVGGAGGAGGSAC
jgi:methionyl-tRNA formyltransferase